MDSALPVDSFCGFKIELNLILWIPPPLLPHTFDVDYGWNLVKNVNSRRQNSFLKLPKCPVSSNRLFVAAGVDFTNIV